MQIGGFIEVMSVKEGDVFVNDIITKGLVDNSVTSLNTNKISWIEQYDKKHHNDGHQLYMAVFDAQKRIVLFREMNNQ